MEKSEFRIFPAERMSADFPWQIWAVGWLCIFKGSLWLAYEPSISESMLSLLGFKYMLQMVPLIIFGIGIWNIRKWAVWGAIIIAAINLIFIIVAPQTFSAMVIKSEAAIWILLAAPILLKHVKKA